MYGKRLDHFLMARRDVFPHCVRDPDRIRAERDFMNGSSDHLAMRLHLPLDLSSANANANASAAGRAWLATSTAAASAAN